MPPESPLSTLRRRLAPSLGAAAARLPAKWERLGDVLVVRGLAALGPQRAAAAAAAYAQVLGARLVMEDHGVHGERREPRMTRLWGDGDAQTVVRQDGIRYRLDVERVMFSSGNLPERQRMARLDARGETVVDLFAGIGYFTLPLLVGAGAERVVACELNPTAARFLRENAVLNGVADRLEVRDGDCRELAPRGVAHRVVAGYFPHGHRYLATALAALRDDGGVLHYHDTARAHRPEGELAGHARAAAAAAGRDLAQVSVRVVKSFAPGVVHAVLDARVAPLRARAAPDGRPEAPR